MSVIDAIRSQFPQAEIHWIARSDMAETLSIDNRIDQVWIVKKSEGLKGLLRTCQALKAERFDYVYDAHSNIRSQIIKTTLGSRLCHRPRFAVRSKERFKRILLFKFGINRFEWPFIGVNSFCKPLKKWGIELIDDTYTGYTFPPKVVEAASGHITPTTVTLVPSANWEMKRWPVAHWRQLVELLPEYHFVVLAGPDDTFCSEIHAAAPERVTNLAGRCSIMESSYIVSQSNVVVSGDTGFLHSADLFRIPTLALIGPTAFGFPARSSSEILSLDLKCRPCTKDGRGKCSDQIFQRCLAEITPQLVALRVRALMRG
ncbi:MAG: glycosyltransferase family 9 protein [Rikenellaceae bacterium]